MIKTIAVVTTLGSLDEARAMARRLVEAKLVACAQVSEIESLYRWGDALQQDKEFRLLLKTTDDRYAEVEHEIVAMHRYELPAIHAFELARVYEPYARWVVEQTRREA
jgi:periplasmic divalent cation tolerance protein